MNWYTALMKMDLFQIPLGRFFDSKMPPLLEVINILQKSVEPVSEFAWTLKDCFRIQLEAINRYNSIIENYWPDLTLSLSKNK